MIVGTFNHLNYYHSSLVGWPLLLSAILTWRFRINFVGRWCLLPSDCDRVEIVTAYAIEPKKMKKNARKGARHYSTQKHTRALRRRSQQRLLLCVLQQKQQQFSPSRPKLHFSENVHRSRNVNPAIYSRLPMAECQVPGPDSKNDYMNTLLLCTRNAPCSSISSTGHAPQTENRWCPGTGICSPDPNLHKIGDKGRPRPMPQLFSRTE